MKAGKGGKKDGKAGRHYAFIKIDYVKANKEKKRKRDGKKDGKSGRQYAVIRSMQAYM
jgi:hypothetical protein